MTSIAHSMLPVKEPVVWTVTGSAWMIARSVLPVGATSTDATVNVTIPDVPSVRSSSIWSPGWMRWNCAVWSLFWSSTKL